MEIIAAHILSVGERIAPGFDGIRGLTISNADYRNRCTVQRQKKRFKAFPDHNGQALQMILRMSRKETVLP